MAGYMGVNMAKIAKALAAIEVGRLDTPGYHAIGTVPGLNLQVTRGGAKSWVLRVKVGTKRREIGLGPYPAITLATAHQKARAVREQIAQGVDPVQHRKSLLSELIARQAQEMTFDDAARAYIASKREGWKNAKHAAQWEATLATYASPTIGKMNVKDVTLAHVVKILTPIWAVKTETASRVRSRMELVLDWAKTMELRTGDNPATWGGNLSNVLAAPAKVSKVLNQPAVKVGDVGAFLADLKTREGMGSMALHFLLLTVARSGEVRGAVWSEIDIGAGVWTVPAARMKAGKEHRVPLSPQALALLDKLPRMAGTDLVFPSTRRDAMLSDATLNAVMKRMEFKDAAGRVCVPHGLRSTFRDWAGERTSFAVDVIEMALAHTRPNATEAAYFRSDLFDKRKRLMNEWAEFVGRVETPAANVVPMRGAA
jgi:integrase